MTEPANAGQFVAGNFNVIADRGSTANLNVQGDVSFYGGAPPGPFRWPPPWDFGLFIASKRLGFIGRDWLFQKIERWLTNGTDQALLILADYGVGKSALVGELIRRNPHSAVVAHHCCQYDTHETLDPAQFVWSIAAQLAQALPAYAARVESEPALQKSLDEAGKDAASSFDRAVAGPLGRIEPPRGGPIYIVIDALDEALEFDGAQGRQKTRHIVELLASRTERLPRWLRILATSRNRWEVTARISGAFSTTIIDAEDQHNIDDLRNYVRARAAAGVLGQKLATALMCADTLAETITKKSGGKFLYAALVLNGLEHERFTVADIDHLPPGMDGFYLDAFERRFAEAKQDYDTLTGPVLGLLAVARGHINAADLAEVLGRSEDEILNVLTGMFDFLREVNKCYTIGHLSLTEWLTGRDARGLPRAGPYRVSERAARQQLAAWWQRELARGTAHERDYLVRHLTAHLEHLVEPAHATIYTQLLADTRWLKRTLELTDVQTLLYEFRYAPREPTLAAIEMALRQSRDSLESAHAPRQLSSQLLAHMLHRTEAPIQKFCADIVKRASANGEPWLRPLTASLRLGANGAHVAALAVLPDGRLAVGSTDDTIRLWNPVSGRIEATLDGGHTNAGTALAVLPNGRLASGWAVFKSECWNDTHNISWHDTLTVRLWNTASGQVEATLEGHTREVAALAVLPDGRLASGWAQSTSDSWNVTYTIKLWNLFSKQVETTLEGHTRAVAALAVLPDGRLASGSWDDTIKLWNLASGRVETTLKGHTQKVAALAVLPDGRLASGSWDDTTKLWNLGNGQIETTLEGHTVAIATLAVLPDGRLASSSQDASTIRLWNPTSRQVEGTIKGHTRAVAALAVLPDGRLASGSWDDTIKLWNLASGQVEATLEGHTNAVTALAVLPNGRLASGSWDDTIKLWNLATGQVEATLEDQTDAIAAMTALPDGRLATGSRDATTIKLWNLASKKVEATLEGHAGAVAALAVLPDGRLASGSWDCSIKLWNLASGQVEATLEGHTQKVAALAVLPDGRLASGSHDNTVKLWNPASEHVRMIGHGAAIEWLTTFDATAAIRCIAVATDKKTIVAGDKAGHVHFLRVEEP